MSQPRRSIRKKRQTQLSFTPLPSSSPVASQYPEQVQRRAAAVRYDDIMSSPTKKRCVEGIQPIESPFSRASSNSGPPNESQEFQVVVPSPRKALDQLPTPAASSQIEMDKDPETKSSQSGNTTKQSALSNSMQPIAGANITTWKDGRSSSRFTSEEEEDDDMPVRSIRRSRPAPVILSSDDSSHPQTPRKVVTPMKNFGLLQGSKQASSSRSESGSEASRDKLQVKRSISPRSTRARDRSTRAKAGQSEVRVKKIPKSVVISDGSGHSSSEGLVITPVRKRKTAVQIKAPTRETVHEQEDESSDDLQGELEDLQETGTPLRSTRTRDGPIVSERSRRQQKLEELRRRRAGIREESQEEDEQDEQDEQGEQYEDDEADLAGSEPINHATRRGGDLDKYEDDFVDDDDDKMGVDLGVAGVPLEFTYHANKKPFEHFKTEIEWMVHNKLNPAFDRYDEMYELAHRKLDKEVGGFAGSKFSSSVWGEEFSKALRARPDLHRFDVPTMPEHKCDACRRSNHPPKHKITFSGKPYNRDTLETIEYDDEDEDDDTEDSDDESSSAQEEEWFFVGRFCCANAEMAHALHHWRHALNQTVLAWLAAEGHLAPAKIVEREGLRQKKRQKATNKIVDGMEDTGVMKMLYKQFKENLAAARDAKACFPLKGTPQIFGSNFLQPERFSNGH